MLKQSPQQITKSVIAAGICLLLFCGPWLEPFIGSMIGMLAPLPLAACYRLHGLKSGRLAVALSAGGGLLLLMGIMPFQVGLVYLLYYLAIGLALGEAPYWGLRDDQALMAASIVAGVTIFGAMALAGINEGKGLFEMIEAHWRAESAMVVDTYREMEIPSAELSEIKLALGQVAPILAYISPGVLLGGSLFIGWFNLLLARSLGRRNPNLIQGDLSQWKAPEHLVWFAIAGGLMLILADGALFWVGMNLVIILGIVYFLQGMTIVADFFVQTGLSPFFRAMIYSLILLFYFLAVMVALVGLFDMWINFRRFWQKSEEA